MVRLNLCQNMSNRFHDSRPMGLTLTGFRTLSELKGDSLKWVLNPVRVGG
jgi:hypothetical protein